jgi:hypothetical protein
MDDFITGVSSASEMDPLREIGTKSSINQETKELIESLSFSELIDRMSTFDDCAYWFQFGVGGPA